MGRHVVVALGVVAKERIAVLTSRAKNDSRSERTVSSAFSHTISDALVWWMKT